MSLLRSIIADARPVSPTLMAKKHTRSERLTDVISGFQSDKLTKIPSSHSENSTVNQLASDNRQTHNSGEEVSKNAHANEQCLSSDFVNTFSKKHTLANPTSQRYMEASTRTKGSNTPFVPANNLPLYSISQDQTDNLKFNEIKPKVMFQKNPAPQEKRDVQNIKQTTNFTGEASNSLLRNKVRDTEPSSVITKTITVRPLDKTTIGKNGGLIKIHSSDYNRGSEGYNSPQALNTNSSSSLLIAKDIDQSNVPKEANKSKGFDTAEQSKMDSKISDDSPYSEKEQLTNINPIHEKDENKTNETEPVSWKNAESDKITSTDILTSADTEPLRSTPAVVVNYDRTSIDDLLQSQLQSFSSQSLAYQTSQSKKKSPLSQEQPKVHIGQIDIIIEAQPHPTPVKPDSSMSQINMASNLLLRRL